MTRDEAIKILKTERYCQEDTPILKQVRKAYDMAIEALQADRPKGRWHYSNGKPATIGQSFGVICDQCGTESEYCTNFCGKCGADMRETKGARNEQRV